MLLTATWCIAHFLSRLNKLRNCNQVAFVSVGNPVQETSKFWTTTCMAESNADQAVMDLPRYLVKIELVPGTFLITDVRKLSLASLTHPHTLEIAHASKLDDIRRLTSSEQVVLVSSGILECPLERDGTLALSTLQSQLPCARGLWYNVDDGESRRAIRFNGTTATFSPPRDGWKDKVHYVSFYESNVACNCSGSWTSLEGISEPRRSFNLASFVRTSHTREGPEKDSFRDSGHSRSQTEGYESFHEVSEADTMLADYVDLTPDVMLKRIQSLEVLLSAKDNQLQTEVCKISAINNELDKQIKEKNACIQSLTKRCDDLDHELSLLKESTETEKACGQRGELPSQDGKSRESRGLIAHQQTGRMSSSEYGEMNLIDNLVHWFARNQKMITAMQQRWEQHGLPLDEFDYGDMHDNEEEMLRFVQGIRNLQSSCSVLNASLESKDRELSELRLAHLTALEEKVKSQRALEDHLNYSANLCSIVKSDKIKVAFDSRPGVVYEIKHTPKTGQSRELKINYENAEARIFTVNSFPLPTNFSMRSCKKSVADSRADDSWDDFNALKKLYEDTRLLSAQLDAKLSEKNEELCMAASRLETAEKEQANLINEINEAKNRHRELEEQLCASKADLERYCNHLAKAEETVRSLEKCCMEADNRCEELKTELDQKTTEVFSLQNNVRDLQQQLGSARKTGEDAEQRNDEPEAMMHTIKCTMAHDDSMQTTIAQNCERLMSYADMERRCENLKTLLQEKDVEVTKLQHSLRQLQQEVYSDDLEDESAQQRFSELEAELECAKSEINRLAADREASKECDEAVKRCIEMEQRHKELEAALERKEIEIGTLQAKMEDIEEKIRCANKRGDDAQWRCGELEADLGRARDELGNLRSRLTEVEENNRRLDKLYNDTKWRNGELEAMLGNKDGEIYHLKNALENLQNEKNCLLSEMDKLGVRLKIRFVLTFYYTRCKELEDRLGVSENAEELAAKIASLTSENERMKIQLDKHYKAARFAYLMSPWYRFLVMVKRRICMLSSNVSKRAIINTFSDLKKFLTSPDHTLNQVSREEAYDELSSELYKLHQKKYSLEKEMSEVQTELFSYQQNHLKLMEERKGLEDELTRTRENAGRLEWFNGELEAQKRSLEQQLAEKNNEIQYLKGEIQNYNSNGQMYHGNCSPAELVSKINYLETELHNTHDSLRDANDKAKWYRGEVDYFRQELSNCHGRIQWLESELSRVHGLLNKQKDSGVDDQWDKLQAEKNCLLGEVNTLRDQLREEGDKRRWYQGEKEYFCNMSQDLAAQLQALRISCETRGKPPDDRSIREQLEKQLHEMTDKAKWYEGEKEHFKSELTNCAQRCRELQSICDQIAHLPDDTFWVQKQPYVDRNRWILCQWGEIKKNPTRRILFETKLPDAHQIYLCLSCFNWECALLMHRRNDGTWYLWVDVPAGRHEFRFMQDGQWHSSRDYNCCWNDYGSDNNWVVID
ncbi:hypothetical protein M514_00830, partial [Trichuris suis]